MISPNVRLDDVVLPVKQRTFLCGLLRNKKRYSLLKQGLHPINRLLLCGPPGCGKTMTAMALASRGQMAYVGLDGLISSFLGQTGTNLRKVLIP